VVTPPKLSSQQLVAITDPARLLDHARALEPALRLSERDAVLGRLEQLLAAGALPDPPADRDWRLEVLAERAVDESALVHLDTARQMAETVLEQAAATARIAVLRALTAKARALAWTGTERATHEADAVYRQAIALARELGVREWHGQLLFWRGQTIFFQNGQRLRAAELMNEALETLGPSSPRRATVLIFFADVMIDLGEWDAVTELLDEACLIADRDGDIKSRGYAAWARAHMMSLRGDALATERLINEVERSGEDWLEMDTGATFRAQAAEMLDRVGLAEPARRLLAEALAPDPTDEIALQARATLLARSGDPFEALEALQELAGGLWLEKRMMWRHTLLTAWATFRAGRGGVGAITARALEQGIDGGGLRVPIAGEPDIVRALAPLAQDAGSSPARELMLDGRGFIVRLFGTSEVIRADGTVVVLPAGRPGELVRMLALHEHGLPVDVVVEAFFPEAERTSGRHRLRQVLLRLRGAAEDIVIREDDHLRLAPAWVDVREFFIAADRMRAARGPRAMLLAYAALATRRGPLLPADPYAAWAHDTREHAEYRHLSILEYIAADAEARGSDQEALTALESLVREGHAESEHLAALHAHLLALGRQASATYVRNRNAAGAR
jgi:DNA-binding SARP family transcriptional activator/tetratricopeptide (TPR) repeat protein